METVAIFVDVQNIYYTTKQAWNSHFNYNYFWQQITQNRKVVKSIAYAISRGDNKQKQFQNILRGIGFEVKLKPYIQRADGTSKGDWDVGITLDIMEYAPQVDNIVLASGDGDYDLLVNKVCSQYQSKVYVYGVASLTSQSLIKEATHFIPIQDSFLLKK